jgi:hypothetical protein
MQVASRSLISSHFTKREATFAKSEPSVATQQNESRSPTRGVDFSRITPRQLQAYCDQLIFTGGKAEFEDASALFTSLPSGIFERAPDTPINLTAQIEGMVEFDRNNGFDLLATFYSGLLDRMKLMEARSVHISVTA